MTVFDKLMATKALGNGMSMWLFLGGFCFVVCGFYILITSTSDLLKIIGGIGSALSGVQLILDSKNGREAAESAVQVIQPKEEIKGL